MSLIKLLLILVCSVLYYGLAILGLGGFTAFFSHPALIALLVTLVVIVCVSFFAGGNLSPGIREDRGNRWVLIPFTVIGLLLGYLPALADRLEFWTIDGETIRWVGVVLFAVGSLLRIGPVFVLKDRFSGLVAIQPEHKLVTHGFYGVIRNPSYLGLIIQLIGWSFAFRSGVGLLLTALILPPLIVRIHSEEHLLRSHFGDEYVAYCARTSRLIPWIY